MKLNAFYRIKPCICGCEHPVLRQDTGVDGKPMPGGYILCGSCGRRTRKHDTVQKCIIAWISSFQNEFFYELALETQILRILCEHKCFIHGSWHPVPCTFIAQKLNKSLYSVRKAMHNLVDEGYAQKHWYVPSGDEVCPPVCGYIITEKAYGTQTYEDAVYKEAQAREKCFNIPKDQTIRTLIRSPRRYLRDA